MANIDYIPYSRKLQLSNTDYEIIMPLLIPTGSAAKPSNLSFPAGMPAFHKQAFSLENFQIPPSARLASS